MKSSDQSVRREIKQTRPFPSAAQEAVVALFRTAELMHREIARVLQPAGITPQQYNVLRILRGAGREGLPTLEIAERMIEQAPGITRLLDRLERKGLVKRERCSQDRRRVTCRIAPAGTSLLARLDKIIHATDERLVPLGERGTRQFIKQLDQIRAKLRASE
ncbi:MAG TPA: MarR family transcriptional regulator [Candidatus Krumholzibacteria bacterium]|nr:MarR family transcriptional regulator [Candidatus Krumholzibacteria bacterium]